VNKSSEMRCGWAANVAIRVTDNPKERPSFPLLIMALTFDIPDKNVSADVLRRNPAGAGLNKVTGKG
jgi:hypothetical protein